MFAYHFLWTCALVFLIPFLGILRVGTVEQVRPSGPTNRLSQRLAWRLPSSRPGAGGIWVHALSVGEVISALPLVTGLREAFPHKTIAFSVTTEGGLAVAQDKLKTHVDLILPMPVDAWWAVKRIVAFVSPSIFILVETDIWPGMLGHLKQKGIKSFLINGRISPRTFRSYRKVPWLIRKVFDPLYACLMQSDLDRERLLAIGIDKDKVITTGNIKFDQPITPADENERRKWLSALGLRPGDPVWVVGSTHPGEEEIVLDAFKRLRPSFPRLCLILAPRDTGRSARIVTMARAKGLTAALKTQMVAEGSLTTHQAYDVTILDTMGELGRIYGLATVSFVGGSLVPIGGHNLLEPASFGVPVVFGPHTQNFVAMSAALLDAGGGSRVNSGEELYAALKDLLDDDERRARVGVRAKAFVEKNQGAMEKVLSHVRHGMARGA